VGIVKSSGERVPLILVVDDDWMNREVLEAHLVGAGYEVMVVHSGEKALETAAQTLPDLVLLDVRMQGMSGYEVCRQLKAQMATRLVMLVTALESDEDRERAIDAGADDFISKPFTSLALLMRIQNLLRYKALRDELENRDRALREVLSRYVDDATAEKIVADLPTVKSTV
jgi:two-component system cell cycle response regulator